MDNYLGLLTGGGDCPGLNAAIRAVVRRAIASDIPVLGIHSGWQELIDGDIEPLSRVCDLLSKRKEMGRPFSIVVVAEDAKAHPDEEFLTEEQRESIYREESLGGIGQHVARQIQERTGLSTKVTVLGYIQRGGSPTAYDRILATRLGVHAVEMAMRGDYGRMAWLNGTRMTSVALEEVADKHRPVDEEIFQTAEVFFG